MCCIDAWHLMRGWVWMKRDVDRCRMAVVVMTIDVNRVELK